MTKTLRLCEMAVLGLAVLAAASIVPVSARQGGAADTVRFGDDDIGGVVSSSKGPEAGVWAIAETTELATKLAKIVVTDERGRYVIPDLPKANYNVWVRGYGSWTRRMFAPSRAKPST